MNPSKIVDPLTTKQAAKVIGITPQRVGRILRRLVTAKAPGGLIISRASAIAYRDSGRGLEQHIDSFKAQSKLKSPLRVKEAAILLGVSRQRVHARIIEGSLKAEKIGGYWLVEGTTCTACKK